MLDKFTATISEKEELGVRGGTYTRGCVYINVEGGKGSLETGGVAHGGNDDVDNLGMS